MNMSTTTTRKERKSKGSLGRVSGGKQRVMGERGEHSKTKTNPVSQSNESRKPI